MIWVEQPVGTGFTQGTPTATSQEESAAQFLGFWKNFMETFDLTGKKVDSDTRQETIRKRLVGVLDGSEKLARDAPV